MTEETTTPLRRNASKQMLARNRNGKPKGSSTRLFGKHGQGHRKPLTRTHSSSSVSTVASNGTIHGTSTNPTRASGHGHGSTGHQVDANHNSTMESKPRHHSEPINSGAQMDDHASRNGQINDSSTKGHYDATQDGHGDRGKASRRAGGISTNPHARQRGLHRHGLGHSGISHSFRPSVIQLEHEDDDDDEDEMMSDSNDFEDLESGDETKENDSSRRPRPVRTDSQLSVGIQPVEPTPPKLSEETVISVSSFADMASALKGARDKSGFVGNDDLISTAVNRSKNFGEMAQMVQGWTKRNSSTLSGLTSGNGSGSGSQSDYSTDKSRRVNQIGAGGPHGRSQGLIMNRAGPSKRTGEDPREFEKVFREYTNTRAVNNPVINSIYRLARINEVRSNRTSPIPTGQSMREGSETSSRTSSSSSPSSSLQISAIRSDNRSTDSERQEPRQSPPQQRLLQAGKKVNSLVATTANQMSDYSERHDFLPDKYSNSQNHGTIESVATYTLNKMWQTGWKDSDNVKNISNKDDAIHSQAMRVQQQLLTGRDRPRSSASLRLS